MNQPTIAFLPLIRVQFDVTLAEQMIRTAVDNLQSAGFSLIIPQRPISDPESAQAALAELAGKEIDLVLIFQATFADSTMAKTISEAIDAPLFLWAVPEPWTGGRLRLNSLCGINLAGHALTLNGRKFDYAYTDPASGSVLSQLRILTSAGRLRRKLKAAKLGVVGEHPNGMDSCRLNEPALRQVFGVDIQRIELEEVFTRAKGISNDTLDEIRAALSTRLDNLDSLQQQPLSGTLSVYQALKEIAAERQLDGLAVRCWPEFFTRMGCAACGAMSLLSDGFGGNAPLPCSCEADINGTLTQLILHWLAQAPSFGTDMVAADFEKDMMALWHCGLAPFTMADPGLPMHGGNHSNRGVPLVMDFPLKPGRVTIARLSQATGELRLVLGQGEVLREPKPFSGTSGVIRFNHPVQQFIDLLMHEGLEHHVSLVYGDYLPELVSFANSIDMPVLRF